jgi:transposase
MQSDGCFQCVTTSGLPPQKKTLKAGEQDRPDIQHQRKKWKEKTSAVDSSRFVFIDESGAKTNMTRLRGRCRGGDRLYDSAPAGRWETTTMIGSIRLDGSVTPMVIEGATDAAVFRAYVKHVLVPALRKGDIVVMDNLSSHKGAEIEAMIQAVGAELWYLPPYSPDLNPIEGMWSKVKESLRSSKARCTEELYQAVRLALREVTAKDAQGWFEASGYVYKQN